MNTSHTWLYPFLFALALSAAQANAAELNPMGGIVVGNSEGTIPTWTGGLQRQDLVEDRVSDPYASDQKLYSVTAANMKNYSAVLSRGQRAMLRKFSDSFEIPVYTSRRSASYPQYVYEALDYNREHAELITAGEKSGIKNARATSPFPVPETGLEAIWNHLVRWRGIHLKRETSWVAVTAGGNYRPALLSEEIAFPYASPDYNQGNIAQDSSASSLPEFHRSMVAAKQKFLSPGQISGKGTLLYDSYDYTRYARIRWAYSPQLRRVLRLPRARLDLPNPGSEGIINFDDTDMFRGSPELFDWELAGRQELLIPYNGYRLRDRDLGYKDLINKHHLNQLHTRYELHRVWKLIATAKNQSKSAYSKRIFYLDEDTWQIVLSEKYDAAGELVFHAEAHTLNFYDVPVVFTGTIAHYNLKTGRFFVTDINNTLLPYKWSNEINPRDFSPNALFDYLR
jgi:hypothetical protein